MTSSSVRLATAVPKRGDNYLRDASDACCSRVPADREVPLVGETARNC
jgi:hypothetical protein